jgi:hypothetical protein
MTKLIIAGSRSIYPSFTSICDYIKYFGIQNIKEVISGGAEGVDREGEHWASHMKVPVKRFDPNWATHGKAAGPIRNKAMAQYGDVLLLIWNGESKGSASMKKEAEAYKLPIYEVVLREQHYSS